MSSRKLKMKSKGPAVEEVQDALIERGYPLPKWGSDADLGWETWRALMSFASDHALLDDWKDAELGKGTVPEAVLEALLPAEEIDGPPELVDLTGLHPLVKGRRKLRKPSQIRGIVLHQTAVRLGDKHKRYYNVACHVAIPQSGEILYVNNLLAHVWHANASNRFTLGMEIDGRFEGVAGKIRTLWGWKKGRTPDKLAKRQILAARAGVRWMVEKGRALGCPITKIYAHRQFSNMRRSDPGSLIWQEVGVWAQEELGLESPLTYTLDTGLGIPLEWDPRSDIDYYGKKRSRRSKGTS